MPERYRGHLAAKLMETQMRVGAARVRIDAQKNIIADLENGDHDGMLALAHSVLNTLEESQALYEACERRWAEALTAAKWQMPPPPPEVAQD